MFRTAIVLAALLSAPTALACGGKSCAHCDGAKADTEHAADAVETAAGTKVALTVTGMHCGSCAETITAALQKLDGVNAVVVDFTAGTARVAFDAAKLDVAKLIETIAAAGPYTAAESAGEQG